MKSFPFVFRYLLASPLLLCSLLPAAEPVYKSVDAQGNISYGDAPAVDAVVVEAIHLNNGRESPARDPADVSAVLVQDLQATTARLREARLAREASRQSQSGSDGYYFPDDYYPATSYPEDDYPYFPYYPPFADIYRPFRHGKRVGFPFPVQSGYQHRRESGDHRHPRRRHRQESPAAGFTAPFRPDTELPDRRKFIAIEPPDGENRWRSGKRIRVPFRDR